MEKLAILVILLISYTAYPQWEKCSKGMENLAGEQGLQDYTAFSLAKSNGRLIVGTLSGYVYFSDDTAKNWSPRNLGLHNYKFAQFAPSLNRIFFASSHNRSGLWWSSNSGENWRAYWSSMPFGDEYPFISLSADDTLFLAGTLSRGVFLGSEQRKISKYIGEGNGLPKYPVYATAIQGDTLFAGLWGKGIYRSTEMGNSWEEKSDGLGSLHIHSLLVRGSFALAGTSNGVNRSTDCGDSWNDVSDSLTRQKVLALEFLGDIILAGTAENGMYLSEDGGKTWANMSNGMSNKSIYSIDVIGDKVFAGTCGGGVIFSPDSCKSWVERNEGLPNLYVGSVNHFGNRLFVGLLHDLVYISDDEGKTWKRKVVWIDGSCGMLISELYFDDSSMFAGTEGTGIYRSKDQGLHWEAKSIGLENYAIRSIIKSNNILYAGTDGKGIYLSSNNGDNWILKDTAMFNMGITAMAGNGDKLFAASGIKVYITGNDGESWAEVFDGSDYGYIEDIELSGNTLLVGVGQKLLISTDYGQNWIQKYDSLNVRIIATDRNVCLIETSKGLMMSTNGGTDWIRINIHSLWMNDLLIMGDEAYATSSFYGEGCEGRGVNKAKLSDLIATSVSEANNDDAFSISPNPASDYIEINLEGWSPSSRWTPSDLKIYNILGECVMVVETLHEMSFQRLDISGLPEGVYLVVIENQNGKLFVKY